MAPNPESRALSQGEIDALLANLEQVPAPPQAAPGQAGKVVKSYDFRRPDKLSKDQMRTLQLLHESFARQASTSLSAYLRTAVQLNLTSLEQGVYGEYLGQIPSDTLLHILSMDPLPGNALISIDLTASMAAADRLLGGPGDVPAELRAPTEIELALIQTIIASVLRALADAWSKVIDLQPAVRDVALDPRVVQIALKGDPVVVISLELGLLQCLGTVTLCLPYVVLEPTLPKLSAQMWFEGSGRGAGSHADLLRRNMESIDVELMAELGGAWVTLQELGQLKEGDVLLLDRSSDQTLDLLVGGKAKFRSRPGTTGNRMAVQVVGWVDEMHMSRDSRPGAAS